MEKHAQLVITIQQHDEFKQQSFNFMD